MGKKIEPQIGKKYGRLTISGIFGKTKHNKTIVSCICDCGNSLNAVIGSVRSGNTSSCGCLQREKTGEASRLHSVKHGLRKHPLYSVWIGIKKRCYSPKCKEYKFYGAIGVKVCDEWMDFKPFHEWCVSNNWEKGLHVDRFPDKSGHYSPENCRITTCKKNNNNRRSNALLTVDGVTKTCAEWAEETGSRSSIIAKRVRNGVSGKEALFGVGSGNKFSINRLSQSESK